MSSPNAASTAPQLELHCQGMMHGHKGVIAHAAQVFAFLQSQKRDSSWRAWIWVGGPAVSPSHQRNYQLELHYQDMVHGHKGVIAHAAHLPAFLQSRKRGGSRKAWIWVGGSEVRPPLHQWDWIDKAQCMAIKDITTHVATKDITADAARFPRSVQRRIRRRGSMDPVGEPSEISPPPTSLSWIVKTQCMAIKDITTHAAHFSGSVWSRKHGVEGSISLGGRPSAISPQPTSLSCIIKV